MSMAIKTARYYSQGGMAGRVYSGDPGFFGDLWKGVKKIGGAAIKTGIGMVTGGPMGAVSAAVGAMRGPGKVGSPVTNMRAMPGAPALAPPPRAAGGVSYAAAAPSVDGRSQAIPMEAGPCPRGYRANKSSYWLKNGTFIPANTHWVKIRRRNSLNPRALNRAIARVKGFKGATEEAKRITVRSKCGCRGKAR